MASKPEPPKHSRFKKGQSGNPKGRPRGTKKPAETSTYDIVLNKTLTTMKNGVPQEVSVEEALQHKTLNQAFAGDKAAERTVLKMIEKRAEVLAKKVEKPRFEFRLRIANDPLNANEAMFLLGIASSHPLARRGTGDDERVLLEPWAVQAAVGRRGVAARLTKRDVNEIKRCTRDAESLRLPAGRQE